MRTRDELPTPCLQIDLKVAKRNIQRLANYAAEHKLSVRPHTETHKSLLLSRLQMDAGAGGLTVAKVGEGEVMAGASRDLLLGYPTLDAPRTERVAKLAHDHAVHVAVDSKEAVDALAAAGTNAGSTIGILVDLDVGF